MKNKKANMHPVTALRKMQEAKMGMAIGSQLEGGNIVYGDDKKKKKQKKFMLDKTPYTYDKDGNLQPKPRSKK